MMSTRYQLLSSGVFDFDSRTVVMPGPNQAWLEYQDWVTNGGCPMLPDPVGMLTLAEAKAARCTEIDLYAAGLRNRFVRGKSIAEMSTWPIKLTEARQYNATNDPTKAPMLSAIATIRGIPLADIVSKVLAQAQAMANLEAQVDGVRGKHNDAVNACLTIQGVLVYDWRAGWEVV